MRRMILFLCLGLLFPACLSAQKKVMAQARTYLKSGKDFDKAEKLMNDLLADSANRGNMKIRLIQFEAVKKQYEQGNEKLYLKQKYDTAALFIHTYKMFHILEAIDSLDMLPDKKGEVKPKYRAKHAEFLNIYRPNLYNGGGYYIQKQDFSRAYQFYKTYLDCATQPLFEGYDYQNSDSIMPKAAYGALYCGYKLKKPELVFAHEELALQDTVHIDFVYQYVAETYLSQKDTANYVATLLKGFEHSPEFPYFFPRLTDYYNRRGEMDEAMKIIDKALSIDSLNSIYRFAKSTVLLNTGKFNECIAICKELIAENDSLADAYYNLGLAYFTQAIELDKKSQYSRAVHRKIRELYEKSRPYMERYRTLAPQRQRKWRPVLYTIYLNLNMGEEFDEINKLRMR